MQNKLKIFCDGGARGNPGPAAAAAVVQNEQGGTLAEIGVFLGNATNNVAEYQAVVEALTYICKNFQSPEQINFYLDSRLVVNQLNGLFKVRQGRLQELLFQIRGLENQIKSKIYYQQIPRIQNQAADNLVNEVLDKRVPVLRTHGLYHSHLKMFGYIPL